MSATAQTSRREMIGAFLRFEYLSVAVIFPLIGSATAAKPLTGFPLLGLLCVAGAFHIFVSLLNDIVDLPLEKKVKAPKGLATLRGCLCS